VVWWTCGLQRALGRARARAEARWAQTASGIAAQFLGRTRFGRWTIEPRGRWSVADASGATRFTLNHGQIRGADGDYLCQVMRAPSQALRPFANGIGPLLVVHYPTSPVVARLTAPVVDGVLAELLPKGHSRPSAGVFHEAPWAVATRELGPITYTASVVGDGDVAGRLNDATGRTVARDQRRYVRASGANARSSLRAWTVDVDDNVLPDAWLLGILLASLNLSRQPTTRRKRL